MNEAVIYSVLVVLGLCLGSFAGATVWRLRARQLKADKANGQKVDSKEYKRLKGLLNTTLTSDRSRCLHCHTPLQWYDLIPLVSWLLLRGRCRQCRQPIGWFEPLMELGMAALFVLSYAFWPLPIDDAATIGLFAAWLAACVGLVILFAYDARWYLLPDGVNYGVAGLGLVSLVLTGLAFGTWTETVLGAVGAVAILSGLYLGLYLVSKGRWIGFGDVKLGLALGLLLGDWQLALLALFLANLIGCLVVIPLLLTGKLQRTSHVPFGPMLIAGAIVAKLFGDALINWYLTVLI